MSQGSFLLQRGGLLRLAFPVVHSSLYTALPTLVLRVCRTVGLGARMTLSTVGAPGVCKLRGRTRQLPGGLPRDPLAGSALQQHACASKSFLTATL